MGNIVSLDNLFHRSRKRIKDLGEVFTPEFYVEDMLNLIGKDTPRVWSDEDVSFFEPCCGHGNIVVAIYRRRLEGIYKKALSQEAHEAAYYAVANALNTLWAIDIDRKNIENCRSRILAATHEFLKIKLNVKNYSTLFSKKKDFFAHILSAIKWHINENETLSALSDSQSAKANANLTKAGAKRFSQNGHHQLKFDLTWANFYEQCEIANTIPLEYERSLCFIENILAGKMRGFEDYEFAKAIIEINRMPEVARKLRRDISVGT